MLNKLEGFEVEVKVKDALPHVSVRFADGRPVLETSALSITGLERMAAVFTRAAQMAYNEFEVYWQLQHEEARRQAKEKK